MDRVSLLSTRLVIAFSAVHMFGGILGQPVMAPGPASPFEGSQVGGKTLASAVSSAKEMGYFGGDNLLMNVMPTRKLLQDLGCTSPSTSGRCRSPYSDYCCDGSTTGATCRPLTGSACPTRSPVALCCQTSSASTSSSSASSSLSSNTRSPSANGVSSGSSSSTSGSGSPCCTKYCANRGGGYVAGVTSFVCCIDDFIDNDAGCSSPCNKFC